MIRLEDIKPGLSLTGLESGVIVTVIAAVPIGTGAVQVICKLPDGTISLAPERVFRISLRTYSPPPTALRPSMQRPLPRTTVRSKSNSHPCASLTLGATCRPMLG